MSTIFIINFLNFFFFFFFAICRAQSKFYFNWKLCHGININRKLMAKLKPKRTETILGTKFKEIPQSNWRRSFVIVLYTLLPTCWPSDFSLNQIASRHYTSFFIFGLSLLCHLHMSAGRLFVGSLLGQQPRINCFLMCAKYLTYAPKK